MKKAAINRLNERIEQVKAQESAEQRTAKIPVDDGVVAEKVQHRTYSSGSDALAAVDSIVPQPETKGNTGVAVGANALNDNERIINAILTNGRTSRYPEFYSREWAQSIVDRMDDSAKAAAIKSIDDFKVRSVEEFKKNNPNREIDEKIKEGLWSGLNTDLSVIVRGVMWDSPAKIDAQEEDRRRTHIS